MDELTEKAPRAPRWVKVFGAVATVVILVFLILLLTGNDHSPGRHLDGGQGRPAGAGHGGRHP